MCVSQGVLHPLLTPASYTHFLHQGGAPVKIFTPTGPHEFRGSRRGPPCWRHRSLWRSPLGLYLITHANQGGSPIKQIYANRSARILGVPRGGGSPPCWRRKFCYSSPPVHTLLHTLPHTIPHTLPFTRGILRAPCPSPHLRKVGATSCYLLLFR